MRHFRAMKLHFDCNLYNNYSTLWAIYILDMQDNAYLPDEIWERIFTFIFPLGIDWQNVRNWMTLEYLRKSEDKLGIVHMPPQNFNLPRKNF